MPKIIVGVDISKDTFDVALLFNQHLITNKFSNDNKGFKSLLKWLCKNKIAENGFFKIHICMEATGNYGESLATFFYKKGCVISIVNPAQIQGFAKSELASTKTDKYDCQLIARFCKAINPRAWHPMPEHIKKLQVLVRRLEDLKYLQQQEINRSYVADPSIKKSIKNIINYLDKETKQINNQIIELIKKVPDLKNKQTILESIPGIGEATIAQILAFFSNIDSFNNPKQLTAFVGLNPRKYQSGTSINGRSSISRVGNSGLRKALYFPAISAKQCNPIVKAFCDRLALKGKSKMVIIVAAMRKLLHIIYGVLKSNKPFNADLVCA